MKAKIVILILCIGLVSPVLAADKFKPYTPGKAWELPDVEPLTEKDVIKTEHGRKSYETPYPGMKFVVMVPRSYSPDKPAGLLLYYHGGRGVNPGEVANPWFHNLEQGFGKSNFIWLKMSFEKNRRSGNEQLKATLYAIARVMKTYKIIEGRGVLTGFSAGGGHISYWINQTGGWPFNHVMTESALIYEQIPQNLRQMSWTSAVSQKEWTSWKLGQTLMKRYGELTQNLKKPGYSWDLHLHIVAGEGHSAPLNEVTLKNTVKAFERSDVFYAAFVYAPDFAEPAYQPILDACRERRLGEAAALAKKAKGTKAGKLGGMIETKISDMLKKLGELKSTDPVLAAAYARDTVRQLQGHPRQKDAVSLQKEIESAANFKALEQSYLSWFKEWSTFVDGGSTVYLKPGAAVKIEKYAADAPDGSLIDTMAKEFLLLEKPE